MNDDNSSSHPEWQQIYRSLIKRKDESLETLRSESLEEIEAFILDFKREVITLDHLLWFLASDALRLLKKETPQKLQKVDFLFYESYAIVLSIAKRDILSGKLKVKYLATLAPINSEPSVIAWCNKSHATERIELSKPHRRIVVTLGDARAWIAENEMPMPRWLTTGHTQSGMEKNGLMRVRERYRNRYIELCRMGCKSKLKTLAKEFNRTESTVRKHIYPLDSWFVR
jgi:hypothetical protein